MKNYLILAFSIFLLFTPYLVCQEKTAKQKFSKKFVEIYWGNNVEAIDHPVFGFIVLSKDRWKNWILRSIIVGLVYIVLFTVAFSLPKTSNLTKSICYVITGGMFAVSWWLTLCGIMIIRLAQVKYGGLIVVLSIPLYLISYLALMNIKKHDISYEWIRKEIENARKNPGVFSQDPILGEIPGDISDFEDEDFIKLK